MGECFYGFLGGLPMSKRKHDYLYVVVDRFTKICILMPFTNKFRVEKNAHLLFQNVWVHFGFPTSIVSDRDSRFAGNF